ncbi:hypothetical protein [Paucibacter sp. KCTC 42545]|uniref:hypothetical protein n=1 Tax=Paucibacter sp. KCTC 42545 TaxID=1768242 RepID=UPI000733A4F9|nr:hypothetical protein [Paucibacter sp. KCTC 42545]ALT77273.1 hypothetical protein AT984_08775 [Paucibacter sp. KCTC 42545]
MEELKKAGRSIGFWKEGESIDAGLTLVFEAWSVFPTVNPLSTAEALVIFAEQAVLKGARVVVDNCDNQFACSTEIDGWSSGLEFLRRLAGIAQVMVCCSNALGEEMRRQFGENLKIQVIDDGLESSLLLESDSFWKRVLSPTRKLAWLWALHLLIWLGFNRVGKRTPLVWFGSHGNPFANGGMLDLKGKAEVLIELNSRYPISLTIISNNRKKFDSNFQGWPFPIHYIEWNRVTFHSILRWHQIALIPSVDNEFTRCKSSNRLTLAAFHGLAVVADPMPAYLPYNSVIANGDWLTNLERLIICPGEREKLVAKARDFVCQRNAKELIASQWDGVFFSKK